MNETIETTAVAVREDKPQPIETTKPDKAAITPAQAKIDAVAALTMSAYEKAATLEITQEESAKLQADFPDDAFQPGAAGKENLIYIEHAHLRDRFNSVFGMGRWAIVPRNRWAESFTTYKGTPGERVYVEAMLVVRGSFVAEAVGAMEYYPKNESQNYGDAVEGAKTAAFRRCAKEFGVGLQAWKKDWCEGWWQRRRAKSPKTSFGSPTLGGQTTKASPTPTQTPAKPVPVPTGAFKRRLLELLGPIQDKALEYCLKAGILLPTETLEELPMTAVPATPEQKDEFMACVQVFVDGGEAKKPRYMFTESPAPSPKQASEPSENSITGQVEQISEKTGTNKNGKPYTKVGIKVAGEWHNTFDTDFRDTAAAAKEAGETVTIQFKVGKFGREIESLTAPEQDDLPI